MRLADYPSCFFQRHFGGIKSSGRLADFLGDNFFSAGLPDAHSYHFSQILAIEEIG